MKASFQSPNTGGRATTARDTYSIGGLPCLRLTVTVQVAVCSNEQRQRGVFFTDKASQRKEVHGRQGNPHLIPGQVVYLKAGGVTLRQPDARCRFAGAENVACAFYLAALQRAFLARGVNQLNVHQLSKARTMQTRCTADMS